MDRLAVVIPARLASTRFPAKLLQEVAGRTVLEWTWSRARAASGIDEVLIATGDDAIARAAERFGAAVVRTGECASGTDRVAEAVARLGSEPAWVVNLQGDEPLVAPAAISRVAAALRAGGAEIVTCGAPLSSYEDWIEPDVVKVVCDSGGRALVFSRLPIPGTRTRPDPAAFARVRPLVLQHVGLYGFPCGLLRRFLALSRSRLEEVEGLEQWRAIEAGIPMRVVAIEWAAPSIDTPADLERARPALEAEARQEGG